ncbi:hypothetical protein [Pseudonocardia nigra]|uniref:hypothetical protein n=1 Tax=Pseudonocardia nigra TaxID=1921578 RepID=UPI001C5D11E5|nr:hypothetical protein [Pseudonocardia nigra]
MPPPPPLWRQAFDAAERAAASHLESLVRTDQFARTAALVTWAQTAARNQANDVSARMWHLLNLPAGTDVRRLRAQIGALDREVRRLTLQLERERQEHRTEEEPADAAGTESAGRPRPRPARRRAQRPAGS